MVLKHNTFLSGNILWFENDVEMYGTQTFTCFKLLSALFENDVEMYGTRTAVVVSALVNAFENDVKMYGTQTFSFRIE